MIASAIDKILSIAQPVVVEVDGEHFSTERLNRIPAEKNAEPVEVKTLSSLVKYVKDFRENFKDVPLLVHVVSPTTVRLMTALNDDREREYLMTAEAELPHIPFGVYIGNEDMLIKVQSMFVDDDETDKDLVLKFAGTVTSGSVKEYGDDGVTQKATIKNGVASKAEAIVPSPCTLRPYRTFLEVEQPTSKFIFRMKEGLGNSVESAFFEADGGAWKNEARANIRDYLEEEFEGTDIVVIA